MTSPTSSHKRKVAKKVVAWILGAPILLAGLIVVSPLILLVLTLELVKWATLNVFGDYKWMSE